MTHTLLRSLALLAVPTFLSAQDILHYRFDDAYGTKATNYAIGSPAPAVGTVISTLPGAPAASWVPGRFGGALAGGQASPLQPNRVDTGWVPNTFTGSFSYALWLKLARGQAAPSLCYLFGQNTGGSFRAFSGTSGLLFTSGFGSSPSSVANIYTLATNNWVHVAFVADAATLTGTYYINGVAEVPKTIVNPTWTSPVAFTIGQQLTSSPGSIWDIDEFLFTKRVLTATEVAALATRPTAGDAPYGGGCGAVTLGNGGTTPSVGNALYQLTLSSATPLSYAIGIGSNRASIGGIPLPFDLGTVISGIGSCFVDSAFDVTTISGAKGPGAANISLPIPADPALDGLTLFLQAPGLGSGNPLDLSNAFSVGIGR